MADFEHIPEEVRTKWLQLADEVCAELHLAGLPASRIAGSAMSVGAEIEVDTGDDEAGGVFVTWRPGVQLSEAAAESVKNGRFEESVVLHSGSVSREMCRALLGILNSAGYVVEPSDDDMRPFAVRVVSPPRAQ
ncbi:hypothetical protein [Actinacidiphila paucisporea]|uniref:hypothetical protein n=1 Tax=Actinacidiphila paucisporea TaxID=310782 RepID=UPI000935E459|nr:hypothetical protein [Actinacidiphila paucisporea]